jgi:hypothetical protein
MCQKSKAACHLNKGWCPLPPPGPTCDYRDGDFGFDAFLCISPDFKINPFNVSHIHQRWCVVVFRLVHDGTGPHNMSQSRSSRGSIERGLPARNGKSLLSGGPGFDLQGSPQCTHGCVLQSSSYTKTTSTSRKRPAAAEEAVWADWKAMRMASAATQPSGSLSPAASSPRLPSPPPFPEVQFGPQSPSMRATSDASTQESELPPLLDTTSSRRIRPGSKGVDMAAGLPLVPLSEVLGIPFRSTTREVADAAIA